MNTSYEQPKVVDYGTLLDLTHASTAVNSDVPNGANGTAYCPGTGVCIS